MNEPIPIMPVQSFLDACHASNLVIREPKLKEIVNHARTLTTVEKSLPYPAVVDVNPLMLTLRISLPPLQLSEHYSYPGLWLVIIFNQFTGVLEGAIISYCEQRPYDEHDVHPHMPLDTYGKMCLSSSWGDSLRSFMSDSNSEDGPDDTSYISFIMESIAAGSMHNPRDHYRHPGFDDEGEDDYFYCENCGYESGSEEDFYRIGDYWYCTECASTCDQCGEAITRRDMFFVGDTVYCQECYGDNYTCCEGCSEDISNDEIAEYCGGYFCSACLEDETYLNNCVACDAVIRPEDSTRYAMRSALLDGQIIGRSGWRHATCPEPDIDDDDLEQGDE